MCWIGIIKGVSSDKLPAIQGPVQCCAPFHMCPVVCTRRGAETWHSPFLMGPLRKIPQNNKIITLRMKIPAELLLLYFPSIKVLFCAQSHCPSWWDKASPQQTSLVSLQALR